MNTIQLLTKDDLTDLTLNFSNQFKELKDVIYNQTVRQTNEEIFLTKQETAELLNISLATVNRRMKEGNLSTFKLKGDTKTTAVRFKKSDVLNLLIPYNDDTNR